MPKSRSRSPKKSGERERERTEKFSRSTIACNGCRMRKQKCGGEKPICLRCRTLNKPCVWPEQLKRGPSKGYNESLELRLHETETVLLSLLAIVSDEQLSSLNAFEIPDGDVTPNAADKKQKLEEWATFPLRTQDDILRWRNERLERDGPYESLMERGSVDPNLDMAMEVGQNGGMNGGRIEMERISKPMEASRMDDGRMEMEHMDQPMHSMGGVGMEGLPTDPMDHIQAAEFENYLPPVDSGHSSTMTATAGPLPASGTLGLSKEFQDTFLW